MIVPAWNIALTRLTAFTVAIAAVMVAWAAPADAQEERRMHAVAYGAFSVQLAPQGEADAADGVTMGRMSIAKQFDGDLAGTSRGEMLTAMTPVEGSAGYVAVERFTGTLGERSGSFVLQHSGVMTRGAQQLLITVVPDSGTGQLAGIAGVFKLQISNGSHFYEFDYSLPE
jgi:hypothetical protein